MSEFKVSLYIRVSTDKQTEGESLEEQESELKKFCEYKKYLIHKTHIERGRSAKDTKRPEYQKLLTDIKDNKINAVIVKKLDRLSRSLLDFEEFMKIAQENNVEFISLKENFDTTNAMGKAMLRVALVFAQLEREQTAERIKDVMQYRASQGLYNGGGVPFGYDVINREIFINKQEKKVIEFIYNRFLEIKSTSAVTKEINNLGYKTRKGAFWDVRKIDKILRRPVYTGKIQWGKQTYQGLHQPIVTEDTFNKVQDIFSSRIYYRQGQKIKGLFRSLLFCGHCNMPMFPNYTKKKNNKVYYYYRCSNTLNANTRKDCPNNYLKMDIANEHIIKQILAFAKEESLKLLADKINIRNKNILKNIENIKIEIETQNNRLLLIKEKKEKYLDSLISKQFTNQERESINNQIEEFTLEEKQVKGILYAKHFELSQKETEVLYIDDFKNELVFLKINYPILKNKEIEQWVIKNIKKVTYNKADDMNIEFSLLNFK